ncbi:MAG TPA: DNA repair protein RecO [Candidatus Magasanikbacteria bacterium]|nr:DNA repair protein RecO [Candidatus Magasanikbacteria bacterium]
MLAVVLGQRIWREHDAIVSVLAENGERIDALAQGLRKITAKNAAALNAPSLVMIEIVPGREISRVGSVQIVDVYSKIKGDPKRLALVAVFLSAVNMLVVERDPQPIIFDIIFSFQKILSESNRVNLRFADIATLRLFSVIGFAPTADSPELRKVSPEMKRDILSASGAEWARNLIGGRDFGVKFSDFVYKYISYHSPRPIPDWRSLLDIFWK